LAKLLPIRERHQKEDRTLINAGEILLVREIHTVSRGQRCLALHGRISVVATIAGPVAISERRFDRAHYYEIAPYLDPSRRYELLNGTIYALSPAKPPRAGTVTFFVARFHALDPGKFFVRAQDVLEIEPDGSPEPDVAVIAFRKDYYSTRHPNGGDAALIIEVGDSERNPQAKMRDYMRDGRISVAWRIDIPGRCVEVWNPTDTERPRVILRGDERFEFEGVVFTVNEIPALRQLS
jgi:Uma2 family endonuclease